MPEEALTSFTVCDAHCYFVVIDVKSRSRREYLIPMDNITVFDLFFNLTNTNIISLGDFNTI